MRAIGADVVWRAWVGRTKTKLNLELAQVLAQKEVMLRDVRKDFGKLAVCQKLKQMELKNSKMTAQKKALAVSIQSNLFSNGKRK